MTRWSQVTPEAPCPACEHADWCAWAPDGTLKCERSTATPQGMVKVSDKDGGALFRPAGTAGSKTTGRRSTPVAHLVGHLNWQIEAECFRGNLTRERPEELAGQLNVTPQSLEAIGIGWAEVEDLRRMRAGGAGWQDDYPAGAYTFPERDGAGRIVGCSLRTLDGRKGFPSGKLGARRGLIVPTTLDAFEGVVLAVEGATDVAACLSLGIPAVGRPSCSGGVGDLAVLLKGRDVLIVAEHDRKPSGEWPGRAGATRTTDQLVTKWNRAVEWSLPPASSKDIRSWLAQRIQAGLDLNDDDECRAAGAELVVALQASVTTVSPSDAIRWDSPEPLVQFDLPSFPFEDPHGQLCPLRPFCAAIAESYQVPIDMPVMLALAVGGAALAGRCEVHVRGDWWEPLNLFVVVCMEPGERKSAVFREIGAPLVAFERSECERLAPEIERNRSDLRVLAATIKKAEQAAANASEAAKREEARDKAHGLVEEQRKTPVLVPPRLMADDVTPEALANLLHEQDGRMAILSPEGGVFEQMSGRYSNGMPNLDVYLKGHAGDEIRVDRVGRPPDFVPRPALTMGLAVQPEVVRGLANRPGLRGRGVLARFLYSLPVSRVGHRQLNPEAVPESVSVAYAGMLRSALGLRVPVGADGSPCPHIIRPDVEALARLDHFRAEVEQAMRQGGELVGLRDWALKLPGAVVRIAGILHGLQVASGGNPGIVLLSGQTMARAISIGRYLIEHAKAAFYEMGADHSSDLARRLLDWITDARLRTFTRREAYRHLRSQIRKVSEVDEPLVQLVEHGYIQPLPSEREGPGRSPSPSYAVNPAVPGHNGQNGQNWVPGRVDGDCVHSVQSVPGNEAGEPASRLPSDQDTPPSRPAGSDDDEDDLLAEEASAAAAILGEKLLSARDQQGERSQ